MGGFLSIALCSAMNMPYLNHEDKIKIFTLVKEAKYSDVLKCLELIAPPKNKTDLLEINFIKALCYKGIGRLRRAIFCLLNGLAFNLETKSIICFPKEIAQDFKIKYLYFLSQLYLMTDQREMTTKFHNLIFNYFSEYPSTSLSLRETYRMLVFDNGLLALRIGKIDNALITWERFVNHGGKDIRILFLLGLFYLHKRNTAAAIDYFTQLRQSVPPQSSYYKAANILCNEIETSVLNKHDPSEIITLCHLSYLKNRGWSKNEDVKPVTFEDMLYLKLRDKLENIDICN